MGLEAKNYWADPNIIKQTSKTLKSELENNQSFGHACQTSSIYISENLNIVGVDNIPTNRSIVIVKNHPCHFDFVLLHQVFNIRPDLRIPIKSSNEIDSIPTNNFLVLRKDGPHANRDDILNMQSFLKSGGSVVTTPWGSLDHMAKDFASVERALQNTFKFASFNNADIIKLEIDTEWNEHNTLPLKRAALTIAKPLTYEEYSNNPSLVSLMISDMYNKYTA